MKKTPARKTYSAFILDADNTLFDFNRAEKAALREALQANGYNGFPEDTYLLYHRINDILWKLFEQGVISQEELRTERFRRLLATLPLPNYIGRQPDPQDIGDQYISSLSEKGYLLPHALYVLRTLSSKVPLLLLSNGIASVQRRRIARSGIAEYFQDILISGEVGISKPDPAIFDLATRALGCAPDRILCVGDSPSSDIRGGSSAGLDTCWFAPPGAVYPRGEPRPTYTISDLRRLLELLPGKIE
jgi:YjjG family noncanonical pyrimidine nucleotidase